MKEVIEFYHQYFAEFEEELQQRTPDEVAYDNIIIKSSRKKLLANNFTIVKVG